MKASLLSVASVVMILSGLLGLVGVVTRAGDAAILGAVTFGTGAILMGLSKLRG